MKKMIILLLALVLLAGCAKAAPAETQKVSATEPTIDPTVERLTAYEDTLKRFYQDRIAPDGQTIEMDSSFGTIDQNRFAVADVNGDGKEELVLSFSTIYTAGMAAWVCGYDSAEHRVTVEAILFPGLAFYPNGILRADASHNHGLAGDVIWPHALYRFDAEKGTYEMIAQVDAWCRDFAETNFNGDSYPTDADPDGLGYVYIRSTEATNWEPEYLSKADFDVWTESILNGAEPLVLPYLDTTLDNISAVSPE